MYSGAAKTRKCQSHELRGKSNAKALRRKKLDFSPFSGVFCDFFCKFVVGLGDL
jgi:hypothetical protein